MGVQCKWALREWFNFLETTFIIIILDIEHNFYVYAIMHGREE